MQTSSGNVVDYHVGRKVGVFSTLSDIFYSKK